MPGPEDVVSDVRDSGDAAADNLGKTRAVVAVGPEVQNLTPLGCQIHGVTLMAGVLLGDLELQSDACRAKRRDHWRHGLAHLEVEGSVLHLHDDVVVESAIERSEVVVRGTGPISLSVAPVLPV